WFIKEIWTPRNIIQHNWESARKINYKTRNKKIYFPQSTINTTQPLSQSNYDLDLYILK
ncbi:13753_t:CDS:1, partial [Gigaspora rosea]